MEYILDVDSSERDSNLYPNPNDYVVTLNTPLYNVTNISLISARIPTSQLLVNSGNKVITLDGVDYTLDEKNYSNAAVLASDLEQKFAGSNVTSVTYSSNTNTLTFSNVGTSNNFSFDFGENSPSGILGFNGNTVSSTSGTLSAGFTDLAGPSNLIMKLSCNGNDLDKDVFWNDVIYTGRILTSNVLGDYIDYNGHDDPVVHYFHKGPEKSVTRMRVRFYYNNKTTLIPYDFRMADHVLKFKIKCSLDKLQGLDRTQVIPEPYFKPQKRNYVVLISVAIMVILGFLLVFTGSKRTQVPLA